MRSPAVGILTLFHPGRSLHFVARVSIMVYSSFALYLLSGPTSVAEEIVTVLGTVLLVSYLCGLCLVPGAAAGILKRLPVGR
jgi:hypothetical protein